MGHSVEVSQPFPKPREYPGRGIRPYRRACRAEISWTNPPFPRAGVVSPRDPTSFEDLIPQDMLDRFAQSAPLIVARTPAMSPSEGSHLVGDALRETA